MSQKNQKKESNPYAAIIFGGVALVGAILGYKHFFKNKKSYYETDWNNYDQIQQLMTCPIAKVLMKQPVILKQCGHAFERNNIIKWVNEKGNCPVCRAKASSDHIKVMNQLRDIIQQYQKKKNTQKPK